MLPIEINENHIIAIISAGVWTLVGSAFVHDGQTLRFMRGGLTDKWTRLRMARSVYGLPKSVL